MKVGFLVRPASDERNRYYRNPAQKQGTRAGTYGWDANASAHGKCSATYAHFRAQKRRGRVGVVHEKGTHGAPEIQSRTSPSSNVLRASRSIPMMTPSRLGRRNVSSDRLTFLAARVLVLREYPPSASSPAKTAISFIPSPRFPRVPSQSVDDVKRCFANPRATVLSEPSPSLSPLGSCSWWLTVSPFSPS
jgi:hypothetical protein